MSTVSGQPVGAVVLAAGASRRMGRPKLLLPVEGKPMIAAVVDEVLPVPCAPVTVVVGAEEGAVRQALDGRPVRFAVNRDGGDMLSSLRCGLRDVPGPCPAFLVVLADQPGIRCGLVRRMVAAFDTVENGIVVPRYEGRRGHPLLLAARFREEVLSRFDGVGLRGLLAAHPDCVCDIEADSAGQLADIDTPEDYRRWCPDAE